MGSAHHRLGLALAALLLCVDCGSEAASGPVPVHWDRDTCERCAMALGSQRFAAEVRMSGDRRAHLFDDVGCALLWVEENVPKTRHDKLEIWVRDATATEWIDARVARFGAGYDTPMGYGYATVGSDVEQSIDLTELRRRLSAREDERRNRHD